MGLSQATLELLVQLKDEASSGLGSLGSALGNVGAIAGGAALAGVVALGAAVAVGVGDAQEARALYASTEQTITSMGNAAGRSADQVVDLASNLSDAAGMSLFGDDQIQQSENLLLTFGNIKGETFDLATALTTDLAQALGGAPADQAMMLGKALNDPIHGMTALGKAGLTFSEEQKAAITAMQESGDMAGAQAIIIAELNKQVGGQAQAAAQAAGGMVQFKAQLGEIAETVGASLLPILDSLMALLSTTLLPIITSGAQAFADFVGSLQSTGESTGFLSGMLETVTPIFNDLYAAAQEVFATLATEGKPILDDLARVALPALTAAGQILAGLWNDVLKPALMANWYVFKTYLLPAIGEVVHVLSVVLPPVIQFIADAFTTVLLPAVHGIIDAIDLIGSGIEGVIGWFSKLGESISSIAIPAWLQGHSPPPMANWFSDIAGAAEDAGGAVDAVAPPGGSLPSLPSFAAGGALSGGTAVNVYLTVQGSVTTQQDLVRSIRDSLNDLGRRNISIFSADVTP
jgi:hypothetical protein